jgi:hypothetical protein
MRRQVRGRDEWAEMAEEALNFRRRAFQNWGNEDIATGI